MKTTTHRFYKPVWFKKWNRKAYSVFRSLGIVVHISSLRASVADQSLLKTSATGMANAYSSVGDFGEAGDLTEKPDERRPISCLLEQLLLTVSTVRITCAPASDRILNSEFIFLKSILIKGWFLFRYS